MPPQPQQLPSPQQQGVLGRVFIGKGKASACPFHSLNARVVEKLATGAGWVKEQVQQVFDRFKSEPDGTRNLQDAMAAKGDDYAGAGRFLSQPSADFQPASSFQAIENPTGATSASLAALVPAADSVAMKMRRGDAVKKDAVVGTVFTPVVAQRAVGDVLAVSSDTVRGEGKEDKTAGQTDMLPSILLPVNTNGGPENSDPPPRPFGSKMRAGSLHGTSKKKSLSHPDLNLINGALHLPAIPVSSGEAAAVSIHAVDAPMHSSPMVAMQISHYTREPAVQPGSPAGLINGYTYMEILTTPWLRKLYGHLIGIFDSEETPVLSYPPVLSPKRKSRPAAETKRISAGEKQKAARKIPPSSVVPVQKPKKSGKAADKNSKDKKKERLTGPERKIRKELNALRKKLAELSSSSKKLQLNKPAQKDEVIRSYSRELEKAWARMEKHLLTRIRRLERMARAARQEGNTNPKQQKQLDRQIRHLRELLRLVRRLKRKRVVELLLLHGESGKRRTGDARAKRRMAALLARLLSWIGANTKNVTDSSLGKSTNS